MLKLEIYVDGDELASFAPTAEAAVGAVRLAGFNVRTTNLVALNPNGEGSIANHTIVVEDAADAVVEAKVAELEAVKDEVRAEVAATMKVVEPVVEPTPEP